MSLRVCKLRWWLRLWPGTYAEAVWPYQRDRTTWKTLLTVLDFEIGTWIALWTVTAPKNERNAVRRNNENLSNVPFTSTAYWKAVTPKNMKQNPRVLRSSTYFSRRSVHNIVLTSAVTYSTDQLYCCRRSVSSQKQSLDFKIVLIAIIKFLLKTEELFVRMLILTVYTSVNILPW